MDYEKLYREALERARRLEENSNGMILKKWLWNVFPELAESEDERIRKWIIDDIIYNMNNEPLNNSEYKKKAEKAIAWLEKQGEKQPIWTDNDRTMAFTLLRDVDQMTHISNEGKNERFEWLNSLEDKFNNKQ